MTNPEAPHRTAWFIRGRAASRRGGRTAGSPSGMSAVTAASSAYVREVNVWPIRASNSSMVSRPCTNAALSASIVCSRSACDPAIAAPPRRKLKNQRNPAAVTLGPRPRPAPEAGTSLNRQLLTQLVRPQGLDELPGGLRQASLQRATSSGPASGTGRAVSSTADTTPAAAKNAMTRTRPWR